MAKLTEIKTKVNEVSVMEFLNAIENETKRNDSKELYSLMLSHAKQEGKMWGDSIIGFMKFVVSSPSGRNVEWFRIGFSPRKNYISLYLNLDLREQNIQSIAKELGKVKMGRGCINFNELESLDITVLNQLIKMSLENK